MTVDNTTAQKEVSDFQAGNEYRFRLCASYHGHVTCNDSSVIGYTGMLNIIVCDQTSKQENPGKISNLRKHGDWKSECENRCLWRVISPAACSGHTPLCNIEYKQSYPVRSI